MRTLPPHLEERSGLVDSVRLSILYFVFDGDPKAWYDCLMREGTVAQLRDDLPYLVRILEGEATTRD